MILDQTPHPTQARRAAADALGAVYDAEAADARRLHELETPGRALTPTEAAERTALYAKLATRLDAGSPHMTAMTALFVAYDWTPPPELVESVSEHCLVEPGAEAAR